MGVNGCASGPRIRELLNRGYRPILKTLEITNDRKKEFEWINLLKQQGEILVNIKEA